MEKTIVDHTIQPNRFEDGHTDNAVQRTHDELSGIINAVDTLVDTQPKIQHRSKFVKVALLGVTAAGAIGFHAAPASAYETNHDGSVTVERGDNLSTIVEHQTGLHGTKLYEKVYDVAAHNNINNPDLIQPGQRLNAIDSTKAESTQTLKYGDTIWDSVKDHYGHVTPELVREVSRDSGVNPDHYLAGTVLRFPETTNGAGNQQTAPEADKNSPHATWTVGDRSQTIWALSALVSAANDIPRNVAIDQIMAENPGVHPKLLQLGDKLKLPGVTDKQIGSMLSGISHLAKLQKNTSEAAQIEVPDSPKPPVTNTPSPPKDSITSQQTPSNEAIHTADLSPEEVAQIDSFNLRDDQKLFLKDTIVAAKQIALTHHINPAVMIAQAIIESNWGNNVTGDFNYFGIKGGDVNAGTGKISHTFEYGSNGRYETDAVFRNYQSPAEAFTDYANLIETHPWFADAAENYKDWQAYLNGLQNGPPSYATAPNYVEVIGGVVGDFHLAELATIGGN